MNAARVIGCGAEDGTGGLCRATANSPASLDVSGTFVAARDGVKS